jgi:hypothetical protein
MPRPAAEEKEEWPFWKRFAVGAAIALAAGALMLAFCWKGVFPPAIKNPLR